MSTGKERAASILQGPEGEEIYLRLVSYAEVLARVHGWRAGADLPGNASPPSIVHDVLAKVLDNVRTWDEKKEPLLLNALKGMVRSDLGHLYEKLEESLVEPIDAPLHDGEERTADSFPSTKVLNPEQHLLRQERTRQELAAMSLVLKEAEGKPDAELVLLALYESDSPADIAAMTGLPIERVYSARRELDRIVRKIPLARVIRAARDENNS